VSKGAPAENRRTTVAIRRVLDDRAVKVVFQPIVDLKTRRIFAYEALVRSLSNDFDSPMSLFAAAVQHQAAGELGRIIRQLAVAGCPGHPLFLNIHPAELNEKWVVQPDDPIFQHSDDVYLEITEGVPLSHFRLCQSILREIRGRGVYLVVDDLGAGYSNLRYIADLHPRVVKLDRDLVAGLVKDTRMFKLVSAIVVLCKELDAMVVAEGIETAQGGRRTVRSRLLAGKARVPAAADHVAERGGDAGRRRPAAEARREGDDQGVVELRASAAFHQAPLTRDAAGGDLDRSHDAFGFRPACGEIVIVRAKGG
jgi:EAL domain-containing protein (putative c-di-GMP-specific phosphodiesterase class I)